MLPHQGLAIVKIKPDWLVLLNLEKNMYSDTFFKNDYYKII